MPDSPLRLVLGLVAAGTGCAHTTPPTLPADVSLPVQISADAFDDHVQAALDDGIAPGFAFAVVEGGQLAWGRGYGLADIEGNTPVTLDTVFPLGSISKTFIGTAAAIAATHGQVDLAAPVSDHLDFSVDGPWTDDPPITFLHLATHTSGIIDRDEAYDAAYAMGESRHPQALSEYLQAYVEEGGSLYDSGNFHAASPGERHSYSNVASGLAALALGEATDSSFDAYTQDVLFDPLEMTSTTWFLSQADPNRVGTLYMHVDQGFEAYPPYALATWPDGGLRTSTNDLSRYLIASMEHGMVDGEQVIPPDAMALALGPVHTQGVLDQPEDELFSGLFWGASQAPAALQRRLLIGHNGADPGIWTFMHFDPVRGRGVIGIANADLDTRQQLVAFYSLAYQLFLLDIPDPASTTAPSTVRRAPVSESDAPHPPQPSPDVDSTEQ